MFRSFSKSFRHNNITNDASHRLTRLSSWWIGLWRAFLFLRRRISIPRINKFMFKSFHTTIVDWSWRFWLINRFLFDNRILSEFGFGQIFNCRLCWNRRFSYRFRWWLDFLFGNFLLNWLDSLCSVWLGFTNSFNFVLSNFDMFECFLMSNSANKIHYDYPAKNYQKIRPNLVRNSFVEIS